MEEQRIWAEQENKIQVRKEDVGTQRGNWEGRQKGLKAFMAIFYLFVLNSNLNVQKWLSHHKAKQTILWEILYQCSEMNKYFWILFHHLVLIY